MTLELPRNAWISIKSKEPTIAKIILIPKRKIPLEMAPKEKYLMVLSIETIPRYNIAPKIYKVKLSPSIDKYTPNKS